MADPAAQVSGRPALPTGIVTFLFTDIEGSTRLLQDLSERYAELLAAHDELMLRAIHEHGGIEVNTEGDAFFAVFTSPDAAMAAAVAAQRALASRSWPNDAAVRVRMGLHTGEGVLGGSDYLGLDVHRAARVAAAAHGGQVLVSDATRALVGSGAIPGLGSRDLGAYRLKDLDHPVRLHQLVAEGLTGEFAPPRARRLGALPTARTGFVGRRGALDELRVLLAATRLLVLSGPGGVGKTRLALELARSVGDAWPDGAFFVPLEALADVRLLPSTILAVLDVSTGSRPAEEALREALAPMRALLVLDNVEQIEGIGSAIDDLLQAAPDVTVVATSRAALRVYGEQEFRVPPLALPVKGRVAPDTLADYDAVALFVERARSSRPDFRLTDENTPAVAEICRLLDGLPLAIELAAARIRMLGPEAILARLDQRLKLLSDQVPNLAPRRRSMRAAIEWSYGLLGELEQRLLDRLGIFVGGWGLAAAEAVCDPDGGLGIDVLEGLGSLLDRSLIDRQEETAEPRFVMLQTIGEYARERGAASGELEAIALRHAEYFRGIVEAAEPGFVGADPAAAIARIVPDQDNVRAALAWSLATDTAETGLAIGAAAWRLWQLRGQLSEGRRYLDALLALPSAAAPTALRARGLTAAGGILYWQSDPAARERYEEALAIYESLADEAGIAESLSNLGFAVLTASPPDPETARGHFTESLRRYEALGDQRMVASLTGAIGFAEMMLGRPEEAREVLERALALNLAGGYRGRAADNRFALGNAHRMTGRLVESAAMYRAALLDAVEMDDAARTLTYLSGVASWAANARRWDAAVRLSGAVRRAAEEQGGTLSSAPGIIEPTAAAREAGLTERLIAAELGSGALMTVDDAVGFAHELLDDAKPEAPGPGTP